MNIELEPGKYVVAVSGGVDSVVLLDVLRGLPGAELVVAHFDHGIREDSAADRKLTQELADSYDLAFEYGEGQLGPGTAEAAARVARYQFLEEVRQEHAADAIVTAHHQDDAIETAVINLLRGTGRKGLSSLSDRPDVRRPLLEVPKSELIGYAREHDLEWREDSTNNDQAYLRNYVRHNLLPRFDEPARQELLGIIRRSRDNNNELDQFLANQLSGQDDLDRQWFNGLPHEVALEVMAAWLRRRGIRDFDRRSLERLVVAAKTGYYGQRFDVRRGAVMKVGKDGLALAVAER